MARGDNLAAIGRHAAALHQWHLRKAMARGESAWYAPDIGMHGIIA